MISIVVHDLSSNAIVRTYPIAKVLSEKYEIEIIGPVLNKRIFKQYKGEFKYKVIQKNENVGKVFSAITVLNEIYHAISGDIVYAFKPKLTSFGIGLFIKYFKKTPLILDIEDLETVKWQETKFLKKMKLIYERFDFYNEFLNILCEKFIHLSDQNIIVSNYLKNKFGGIIIVHGANTKIFNPSNYNKAEIRKKLNLNIETKYILFSGLPREHKGVEELISAVKNINRNDLKLLIVGGDINDSYYKRLLLQGNGFIKALGPKPHNQMPAFLAASDMVVIPQRKTLFAQAQVPAKVFEAMSMAKPIISTNISDLKEILNGCGIIIEPSKDTTELENKIKLLLNDTTLAKTIGQKARIKCEAEYSWNKMGKKLYPIFDKYFQN